MAPARIFRFFKIFIFQLCIERFFDSTTPKQYTFKPLSVFKFKPPFCDILTNLIYDTLNVTVMNLSKKYHS